MINLKFAAKILGALLVIESLLLCLTSLVDLIYGEGVIKYFLESAGITLAFGCVLLAVGYNASSIMKRRDGYFVVTFAWIMFSFFGMLPFYISGYIPDITDSYFETMSGFTTTGASIIDNIEEFPHALLFWRSIIQWIGGLGMIFFTIAVLPVFGASGMQLFAAETTRVSGDKIHPRIGVTAKWIWIIYLSMTVVESVLLWLAGMNFFDSVCHSFTTTATGGFSTKQSSIMYYNSPLIEYIISFFMILSGINFTLLYLAMFKGRFRKLYENTELKTYLVILTYFVFSITGILFFKNGCHLEKAFREALFQVSSLQTTTGFTTVDYMQWPTLAWLLLILTMFIGACGGSTTGSIKCVRYSVLIKLIVNEFKLMMHPNAVLPVKLNGQVVSLKIVMSVLTFVIFYILILIVGTIVITGTGVAPFEALVISASSLGNVGPGVGSFGPVFSWSALPDLAKWCCSLLMLVGRLEIFTVLLLFVPNFWRKV